MPERFRIGIALSLFPPVVGGAELLLYELACRWVERGHATTVFTRTHPEAPAVETMAGITIRRAIRTIDVGPLFGLSFVASLIREIHRRRHDFDVLVAFQAPWESAATGWIAGRTPGLPTVAVVQQSGPFGDVANLNGSKFSGRLQKLLRNHRAFVGLSDHARQELLDIGCPADSIHVIRNGIDLSRFSRSGIETESAAETERARTVLFVGRFTEQKNPMLLLEAWKLVCRCGDYRLLLVGAGDLESKMREYCDREKLRGVEFLGRQSDMPAVYRKAATFVLPSRGEGCCMALLEAMAGGLCPVVTAVGGNLDVVTEEQNGLLVSSGDSRNLWIGLSRVLEDAELRNRLGNAAAGHIAQNHNIDIVAERYLELFGSL